MVIDRVNKWSYLELKDTPLRDAHFRAQGQTDQTNNSNPQHRQAGVRKAGNYMS